MKQHLLVNWIDGMKISKDHLIALENSLLEHINSASSAGLTKNSYGLLPVYESDRRLSEVNLQIDSRSVVALKISDFRAVTLGGSIIEIEEKDGNPIELSYSLEEDLTTDKSFLVILAIAPFSRTPFGDADPEEEPPRRPNIRRNYNLSLVDISGMDEDFYLGPFHLPVGKLDVVSGKISLDQNYIPPCVSLSSHKQLKEVHKSYLRQFNNVEHYCTTIINKIYTKKQAGLLVEIIKELCENIIAYLNQTLPLMKRSLVHEQPVRLIEIIEGLGRTVKAIIDTRQNCGKEELLNYLTNWCDINQVNFERAVAESVGTSYNHSNIAPLIQAGDNMMELLGDLFRRLSELDYIGEQGDVSVFITEEADDKKTSKRKWF